MEATNSMRRMVASLDVTKHRNALGLFKAEGTKCVLDTLYAFKLHSLFCTSEWWQQHSESVSTYCPEPVITPSRLMSSMSSLATAPPVIAVYHRPVEPQQLQSLLHGLVLALDGVQDPGNLGTIIRTADWFGVESLLCSQGMCDAYSPKVVMATMGAIARVRPIYCNLPQVLSAYQGPIVGMALDGTSIYHAKLPSEAVVVMGSEGHGLSTAVADLLSMKLLIPSWPPERPTSESLNVAIATAITLSNFRSNG